MTVPLGVELGGDLGSTSPTGSGLLEPGEQKAGRAGGVSLT